MQAKILVQPKNEQELVELKTYLAENDINLAKMKNEVDCVYEYLEMFEQYSYDYNNFKNYWALHMYPSDVKMAVMDGLRNASITETKL